MVIATGFFDGVHLGHRHVLNRLVESAAQRGDESMVVTFWPHPRNVLQDDARNLRLLTALEEKKALILGCGVNHVEVLPFTKEFSRLDTRAYLRDYVRGRFGGKAILLGYDNRIGSDLLRPSEAKQVAEQEGLEVIMTDSVEGKEGAISSTKIRSALLEGNVRQAASMLGRNYTLLGVVVAGDRLGRTIGFPTANLLLREPLKLVPGNGVYEVEAEVMGKRYRGMCNIGVRPTVKEEGGRRIETNIFGFDEDIYGLDLRLDFVRKVRDERKFASLDELKEHLAHDKETILAGL